MKILLILVSFNFHDSNSDPSNHRFITALFINKQTIPWYWKNKSDKAVESESSRKHWPSFRRSLSVESGAAGAGELWHSHHFASVATNIWQPSNLVLSGLSEKFWSWNFFLKIFNFFFFENYLLWREVRMISETGSASSEDMRSINWAGFEDATITWNNWVGGHMLESC